METKSLYKLWIPCFSRSTTSLLLVSVLIRSTVVEAIQVIGGNITVALGGTVVLPCKLVDTTEMVTQISWQRMTRGKPHNENFFTVSSTSGPKFVTEHDDRFEFIGSINERKGSLQLSNVTLMDQGTYTCIFTLFPSGNFMTKIPLNLLVPPVSSLEDNHPVLGNEEVSLVTCKAAGSKPPAEVRWLTGSLTPAGKVRTTTSTTEHDNGTTTTVSSLFAVPTIEINQHLVQCVISNAALSEEEILPFTLQIYFSPMEVNVREQAKGLFECVTEANPNADYTWSRSDNPWPQSAVRAEAATLQFLSMTPDLNGLYQCEASNSYGTKHSHLYVHVISGACTISWTFLCLLLLLNVVAAAVWYFYRSGKFPRKGEGTSSERQAVPTASSTHDVADGVEEEEEEDGGRLQSEGSL